MIKTPYFKLCLFFFEKNKATLQYKQNMLKQLFGFLNLKLRSNKKEIIGTGELFLLFITILK
jgi:hypothetical protein